MAYIIEVSNPYQPLDTAKKHFHPGGVSIRGWLEYQYPGFIEFPVPTICIVNGKPVVRSQWDQKIQSEDVVNFIAIPEGVFIVIAIVVIAVIALTVLFVMAPKPVVPGEAPASDPVFSTKGQSNSIRLGEPIEVCYGKNRIYPSFASRPYFQYQDNDQFQYALFCLGQGEYDIETLQIGDTDINNFQEVESEIIPPGGDVTLFPINVVTSVEAGGQTLFGPNEPEYVAPGWVGPFAANDPETIATIIQVDIIFPKGVYVLADSGEIQNATITVEVEIREIDGTGAPIGGWIPLPGHSPEVVSASTTTPQRRTLSSDVTPGRYEVRMRRTSDKNTSYRAGNDVIWEGLRAYITADIDFGDVTLWAVKIRATNNLNDKTQLLFNAIATRKLPVLESGGWTAPQATRSIVWAFADVFRSVYGGRIFDDSFFDWDALQALDELYTIRGDYFDWIFRDPITVWEAAQTVARAGRATPMLVGSLITMKRDGPQLIPVAMFSPENMVKGSFNYNVKFWDLDEFDSIRVEYTEPSTGYKQEHILITLPGGTTDHPEDIRFPGISSRAQAYREGLYLVAANRYLRENITFDTGLEGYIPTFGDLIAIAHDTTRWGQAGFIVNAQAEGNPDTYHLWTSEPLDWSESGTHQILLRARNGDPIGPLTAIQTTDPQQVMVTIPAESSGSVDFLLDGTTEPMLYVFGIAGNITKYAKVVKIEPSGNEAIRITAVNDAPVIHSFDSLETPPFIQAPTPPKAPDLPEIASLYLTQLDASLHTVQASWSAAFGAQYYLIQISHDGTTWEQLATTERTSLQFQADVGPLYVRVAAVNTGQGPWISDNITIGSFAGLELITPFDALEWAVRWTEVLNTSGYRVKVYDASSSPLVLKHQEDITDREFTYNFTQAVTDGNIVRDMVVEVDAIFNGTPSGFGIQLEITNSIASPPTGLGISFVGLDSGHHNAIYHVTWTVPHEDDLIRVRIWVSIFNGFDASTTSPTVDEYISSPGWAGMPTGAFISIPLDSFGGHAIHYWRVALSDVWGNEISTNLSSQQVTPVYP